MYKQLVKSLLIINKLTWSKCYGINGLLFRKEVVNGSGISTLEPLRRRAAKGLECWKQELVSLIEKGIAEGVFKSDTAAAKTALHIIALCEFAMSLYSATKSLKQTDEVLEMAVEVAKGIMVNP